MRNNKGNRFNLRLKQIFLGLTGGFIGMFAFAGLIPPSDLYADIRNALLAGFFSMIAAIALVTHLHNRQKEKGTKQE